MSKQYLVAFRSEVDSGALGFTGAGNTRVYPNATPSSYEPHQCPADDPWGVQYVNDQWYKNWKWGACLACCSMEQRQILGI